MGFSAASELSHTPSTPFCGSMYQKVSMPSCCSPFDWLPALIAQMLNQPAFLIVPSGFSTISVSLRGRSEIVPWATAPNGQSTTASATTARHKRIVSSLSFGETLPRSLSTRHVRVHHLRGIDDAVEFRFANVTKSQSGLLQRQVVLGGVMCDLRGLVIADHRGERRHQHQRALDVALDDLEVGPSTLDHELAEIGATVRQQDDRVHQIEDHQRLVDVHLQEPARAAEADRHV